MNYQNVADELNNQSIRRNFLCKYHQIDTKQVERINRKGKLLCNIFRKINVLYRDALIHDDKYLLDILESGLLRKYKIRKIHRNFFIEKKQRLPFIFRGDTTNLEQFVEFNVGLEGLGYVYTFREIMEKYYGETSIFNFSGLKYHGNTFVNILGGKNVKVFFLKSNSRKPTEVDYFLNNTFNGKIIKVNPFKLRMPWMRNSAFADSNINDSRPILLQTAPRKFFINMNRKTINFWKSSIQKIFMKYLYDMINLYHKGNIDIEPPPNLLYEQKTVLAVVWDNRYKDYFTDEEKTIFPKTCIIQRNTKMEIEKKLYTLQDIIDMPSKRRKFVVKYAGLNFRINWGGKSVYRLSYGTKKEAASILKHAVTSYERYGEPWVIQKDIAFKESIEYFNFGKRRIEQEIFHRLYRVYYMYDIAQDRITAFDIPVYFCRGFIVSGKRDSVYGLVSIDNIDC